MNWHELPEVAKALPGALGSLFSMIWIRDHWMKMVGMFFGGVVLSFYGSDYVVKLTSLPAGLSGFLLGVFGMSVVASLFTGVQKFSPFGILNEYIRMRLKLPPKEL